MNLCFSNNSSFKESFNLASLKNQPVLKESKISISYTNSCLLNPLAKAFTTPKINTLNPLAKSFYPKGSNCNSIKTQKCYEIKKQHFLGKNEDLTFIFCFYLFCLFNFTLSICFYTSLFSINLNVPQIDLLDNEKHLRRTYYFFSYLCMYLVFLCALKYKKFKWLLQFQ